MENRCKTQSNLKLELETLTEQKLSEKQIWESYFNLKGFFQVLEKMKKEARNA